MVSAKDSSPATRIASVDLLRGLVMVLMALDHTRDYVHSAAMNFPPENLAQTTPAIFLTRWITHLCAPVFMFCAGAGAWFWHERRGSTRSLSWFLVTRGLWLIVLEVTIVRMGLLFELQPTLVFLLVFWALGMSMIALALLVHLPWRVLLAVSIAMIALHNLTDVWRPADFGAAGWLWQVLHQPGLLSAGPPTVIVAYPLVPWIAVMALGYCAAPLYRLPSDRRRQVLIAAGVALTVAFLVVRAWNGYGDPRPWSTQRSSAITMLSFLNATKYPPSLAFLLMTLGPALVLLGLFDRLRPSPANPLLVFGRVPLFYFVLHIPLVHAIAMTMTRIRYGAAPFLFMPPPTLGSPRDVFPPDYGWDLWVAYLVTGIAIALLYPICLWFSRLKAQRRTWWLSYL